MRARPLGILVAFGLLVGCHDRTLDASSFDAAIAPCERAGGRCLTRALPDNTSPCAADEFDVESTPQLCGAVPQSCCVTKCPSEPPALGGTCRVGAACSYVGDLECLQYDCFEGNWVVTTSACGP